MDNENLTFAEKFNLLSKREKQVAFILFEGKKQKDAAEILKLSPKSISTYTNRMYSKLSIKSLFDLGKMCALYNPSKELDDIFTAEKIRQKELKKVKNILDIV